jgi:hypothetical protein
MYIYGLGPAMFYGVLPEKYWVNYCQLVYGMRIILQNEIPTEDLINSHHSLLEFCKEFEALYYQCCPERLHFVRQSIHALLHVSMETVRIGPSVCSLQWTMERTIGNLVEEIHQPSNPYANLSRRGLQQSQVNALKAMFPELDEDKNKLPRGAINLGNEYFLLRAMEQTYYQLSDTYLIAFRHFLLQSYNVILQEGVPVAIRRWARLLLPTGQVVRSYWKESLKPLEKVRMARNVKVNLNRIFIFYNNNLSIFQISKPDGVGFCEVKFFFQYPIEQVGGTDSEVETLAFVSEYQSLDQEIFRESKSTVWWYTSNTFLKVIHVKNIISVVAMIPKQIQGNPGLFVCEKPGLDVAQMGGIIEAVQDE